MTRAILLCFLLLNLSACGLYRPPKRPELFTAQEVKELNFRYDSDKVILSWSSPELDRQGEKLQYLDGYKILRRGPSVRTEDFKKLDFKVVAFIKDSHLAELKKQREIAINSGEISRKVKLDPALMKFTFSESIIGDAVIAQYQIVPVSNGIDGLPSDTMQIFLEGDKANLLVIKSESLNKKAQD